MNIPVRYRQPDCPEWLEGKTANISGSGLLLHTQAALDPQIPVELRFELPISVLGEARGEVICKGTVVRTQEDPLSGIPTALAIAIRSYRMTRGGQHVH
jgi:hypothetical protein